MHACEGRNLDAIGCVDEVDLSHMPLSNLTCTVTCFKVIMHVIMGYESINNELGGVVGLVMNLITAL